MQVRVSVQIRNIVRHYAAFHAHQLCLDDEAKAKWEAIPVQNDVLLSIGEKMMPKCLVKVKECEEGTPANVACPTRVCFRMAERVAA